MQNLDEENEAIDCLFRLLHEAARSGAENISVPTEVLRRALGVMDGRLAFLRTRGVF